MTREVLDVSVAEDQADWGSVSQIRYSGAPNPRPPPHLPMQNGNLLYLEPN